MDIVRDILMRKKNESSPHIPCGRLLNGLRE
jgi:hypothetical protein